MSTETPEYGWIPDGSSEFDWREAIEQSAHDTGTAAFPSEKAAPLTMADVARVDAYAISYHDERWKPGDSTGSELRLTAVLELTDGRWASLEAWNDYTGWGCQDGSAVRIGADRDSVVRFGLTDEGRLALGLAEPGEQIAATPPTPKNVADMLTMGDNDYHDGNNWKPSLYAEGNVVHIKITPYSEPDEDDLDDEPVKLDPVHFRAVVLPGEAVPIVLPRLNTVEYSDDFEGGAFDDDDREGWQAVHYSHAKQRTCFPWEADSILFRGAPGVISPAEARRFAAALASLADGVEAAQAERDGGSR
jgi:hypothetical protein